MLTVRDQQLRVMRQDVVGRFVEDMIEYIAGEFPGEHRRLGEAGTRRFVEAGIEKAATRDIRTRGAVAVYIDLMLRLGQEFELAPAADRAWAARTLANARLPDYIRVQAVRERFEARTGGRVIRPAGAQETGQGRS